MKKYDDIIFSEIESDSDGYESFYRYDQVVKAIKIAQIDAIDEAVERCAKKAVIRLVPGAGLSINKIALLQVAKELKKELEWQ